MIVEQRGTFMKRDVIFLVTLVLFLGLLPGCGKIIDWAKENFDQGEPLKNKVSEARKFVRFARIYDQFELVGGFDAVWLSDDLRILYSDLYALKNGKNQEQREVFLRRQLEENNHFISFYVLALQKTPLNDQDSIWSLFLKIGDKIFLPNEIKIIDLSPEYIEIFGKKYSKFKDPYLVYFNAKDVEDHLIISEDIENISLMFRTLNRETTLSWSLREDEIPAPAAAS